MCFLLKKKSGKKGSDQTDDNVNIWDDNEPVSYEDESHKHISYATFNKLVEYITSPEILNVQFVQIFLLGYKAVTTPELLLKKLIERYNVPEGRLDPTYVEKMRMRICIFLKQWMENRYESISDELREKVLDFLKDTVSRDLPAVAESIQKTISSGSMKRSLSVSSSEPPPKPKLPKSLSQNLSLLMIDPLELARQLTLILFSTFVKIDYTEFFGQAWSKPNLQNEKSPNLLRMITLFNEMSSWVSSCIVNVPKIRDRVKTMEHLVHVANELRKLKNYFGVAAFVAAFGSSPISRLKWTIEKLSPRNVQMMKDMETLLSPDSAFKNYREALKEENGPCIPHLLVSLKDLTFIEDGNPDRIGRRINFSKQLYIYNVIDIVKKFQHISYNLEPVQSIQTFFNLGPKYDDRKLYELSLLLETRNATRRDIQ